LRAHARAVFVHSRPRPAGVDDLTLLNPVTTCCPERSEAARVPAGDMGARFHLDGVEPAVAFEPEIDSRAARGTSVPSLRRYREARELAQDLVHRGRFEQRTEPRAPGQSLRA
jgi:hypothetical protein